MRKPGRPSLPDHLKVRNQRVSIDFETYQIVVKRSKKQRKTIKKVIKEAILSQK